MLRSKNIKKSNPTNFKFEGIKKEVIHHRAVLHGRAVVENRIVILLVKGVHVKMHSLGKYLNNNN